MECTRYSISNLCYNTVDIEFGKVDKPFKKLAQKVKIIISLF